MTRTKAPAACKACGFRPPARRVVRKGTYNTVTGRFDIFFALADDLCGICGDMVTIAGGHT